MDPIDQLRDEFRRSLTGPAWHGPALLEALDGLEITHARIRPIPGAHSIGELALHALAWIEEVTRRLTGTAPALPERGDWPDATGLDARSWDSVMDQIRRAGDDLDRALASFPADRLERTVGEDVDAPVGSGVSYATMLNGLVQHNAYHGGQILLLSRAHRPATPDAAAVPEASAE